MKQQQAAFCTALSPTNSALGGESEILLAKVYVVWEMWQQVLTVVRL